MKEDTNTLREEWKTYAYNDPTPENIATDEQALDYIADYWLNKFNQKLEEIGEEIQKTKWQYISEVDGSIKEGLFKDTIINIIKNKKN